MTFLVDDTIDVVDVGGANPSINASNRVRWDFIAGLNDLDSDLLALAKDRKLHFDLRDNCSVNFTLNLLDPASSRITELLTDIKCYRNGTRLFRGRVGNSQPKVDESSGYKVYNAADYRSRLKRRFIYDDDNSYWFGEDVCTPISDMLAMTQGRVNGDLGITLGIGFPELGITKDEVDFQPGTSIAANIDSMGASKVNGYDWEVDPNLVVNVWAQRGTRTPKNIELRGGAKSVDAQFTAEDFANAARASGGEIPEPIALEATTLATDSRGRWETQVSWPDVETQTLLNDRTEYLLEQVNIVPKAYHVALRNGFWNGPAHLWLGDTVLLNINYGTYIEAREVRVQAIDITPTGDGDERVEMDLK